ncbi:MAG TPA: BON domain-containing protein [Verrucomicrobiae bacterium]|nr:BON domain-containing protein [Verrucomicrobiae bacterium]
MTKVSVKLWVLITGFAWLPFSLGLTGCAGDRNESSSLLRQEDHTAERSRPEVTEQSIEDSRTAERAREALAAGADYRYDGVKVTVCNGIVQLNGFVISSAQRTRASAITRKVTGVRRVENNLAVKD